MSTAVVSSSARPALAVAPVAYQPVLDIERGSTAGYQAVSGADVPQDARGASGPDRDSDQLGRLAARTAAAALAATPTLPAGTFMMLPMPYVALAHTAVRETLERPASLSGVVLDITGFSADAAAEVHAALAEWRRRGALVAVGGEGMPQPELSSIVRLKPSFVRLGRAWVRGVDTSDAKRSAIEVTGRFAGQLDAWIVAEGVTSAAELRALCGLGVPLAQGSFIGEPQTF